jgi:hypothetical protein
VKGHFIMSDLMASGTNPGATYTISPPTDPGVYHEDRVVVTTVSGTSITQMFRVYGAQFDPGSGFWSLQPGVSVAYATVQNPDGSIHYFTQSDPSGWMTSEWLGSGNNAVFNAVDYGMSTGDPSGGVNNVTALQAAINAAISGVSPLGGTVTIPAGTYELSGTVTVSDVTNGLVIRGESAGTILYQQGTPGGGATNDWCDTFHCSNNGVKNQLGVRFRDLTIKYLKDLTPSGTGIAINCSATAMEKIGSAYTSAENCAFVNCPQAFSAGSSASRDLHSGLVGCSIFQSNYNNSTQVLLSGAEDFVINCELSQMPMSGSEPGGGPTGCTGIAVGSAATGCKISGCHISDFYTGILIGGGHTEDTWITDCRIDAAIALSLAPSGGTIYGVYASACTFAMIENYTASPATSGVLINAGTGSIASVVITGCIAYGFENAGIEIDSGQNIVIVGGQYSSNGQIPSESYLGAGIAIAGGQEVTISGADCSGVNEFWQAKFSGAPAQPYAIAVSGLVSDVTVTGCHLPYNATGGVLVAQVDEAVPEDVFIRDCNAGHYSSYSVAMNIVSSG